MTLYGWSGPGQMRVLSQERAQAPVIEDITTPVVDEVVVEKLHLCTVSGCGKKFKLRAILARHFNANHSDLRKDKDTWRDYTDEIWT